MADSGFSLTKLFGWLKGFLKSMPSPLGGLDMSDVKVNTKDGKYSALFTFDGNQKLTDERGGGELTDIKGNAIKLNVLISAINVNDALAPLLNGMNKMSKIDENVSESKDASTDLLNVLLGKDRQDNLIHEKSGKGLLGLDPKNAETFFYTDCGALDGKTWSWGEIASDYLKYSLECLAEGKDHDAIENQTLTTCQDLISEYLVMMDIIASKEEVKVDILNLCLPILITIQGKLSEYYQDAYNKMVKGKSTIEEEGEKTAVADEVAEDIGLNDENAEEFEIPASKQISVKLHKITASNEIQLLGLTSNYLPGETLDDLEDVIYQDEFMDMLTEEPQSFNIDVDNDGYDISTCEDCEISPCESLGKVLQTGICFYRNLYILHWMSKGNDMMKLHLMTEDMYSELIKEIDTLGELMVEKCGTVISPSFGCDYLEIRSYEFQEGIHILEEYIQGYLDVIDYAYPNQTSDVQSTLDEWLRYWNKQMNYFIKGQEG